MTVLHVVKSENPESAALGAAQLIGGRLALAVSHSGRATLALSGGRSCTGLFDAIAKVPGIPWPHVVISQADERFAPLAHPDRNLTALEQFVHSLAGFPPGSLIPLPADGEPDQVQTLLADYECDMQRASTGTQGFALDVVHLGLGSDGHTASLFPGDPVLETIDRFAAVTNEHNGYRRITLTYLALENARTLVWLVTGVEKAEVVRRLLDGSTRIPAGRVRSRDSWLFVDEAAMG